MRKIYIRGLSALLVLGAVLAMGQAPYVDELPETEVEDTDIVYDDEEAVVEEEEYYEEEAPAPPPAPVQPEIQPKVTPTRPTPSLPARPTRPLAPSPTLPPGAPAPLQTNDFEPRGAPGEPIAFDFRDTPLYNVVESIARMTGRNFDIDPNIAAVNVTVITHDRIPPEMAFQVLESILASRGFSMVEAVDGHLIKIINTADATYSAQVPLRTGAPPIPPDEFDKYATHIIQIQHTDAADLATAFRLLGSRNARIDTYAPTNTLIITDTADGLRRIWTFLEAADVPGFQTTMEIFTLEYTRAEVIADQLNSVLMEGEAPVMRQQVQQQDPARPVPTRPAAVRPVRAPTVPGQQEGQIIGSREEVLRTVTDERLNALIVVASEGMMERVRDLVRRLDTPTPHEANTLHIYELRNATAEAVETAIQPLLGMAPRAGGGGAGGGQAGGGGGQAGGGAAINPDIQPFERNIHVSRYEQTNALLIVASPQDYQLLEAFIARLDVPQRQVLVQAMVMDVTLSNDFGVTVDAAKITANDGFAMTNTGNIQQLASVANAADQIVGGPQAALASSLLGLGTDGGLTAGVFDDLEVTIGGRKVKLPFVPLLFQALEIVSDIEVLSMPSIVTVDNEAALIHVGENIPFVSSTSRPPTGQQTPDQFGQFGGYTRVERMDVGVIMEVTPQISEGDNVMLDISIEVSDTDATQVGTVDILGPTINLTKIQDKIFVRDGSTVVIAGLIRETATRRRNQAPILGDLPYVGWMFQSKTNRRVKRNLVVLVTPHIVKEAVDYDRATQYMLEEYHDANLQHIMETGFFRKVARKHELRRDYRPTFQRTEELIGQRPGSAGSQFGRGDIAR